MKTIDTLYYITIPLLIVGVSLGYTTFLVALLALLPLLVTVNRHTLGLFFLMYGGPLGGVVRTMYPSLPIYGVLLEILGLLLIWDLVRDLLRNNNWRLLSLFFILAFFGLFYIIGPKDSFANQKYLNMCIHGIMTLFGYYAFDCSRKIEAEKLARILMIASICLFTYVISAISMQTGDILDFNWFRAQSEEYARLNMGDSEIVVGYQQIGMLILFSVVVLLSQVELSKGKSFFYIICAFELVLVSGCRQAILGVVLAVILRLVLFRNDYLRDGNVSTRMLWISISLIIAYFVGSLLFTNVGSDYMSQTVKSGDRGRSLLWMYAVDIFKGSPLLGAGLGGYFALTGEAYPHNFFLELLAETGIVGLLVSVLFLIIHLSKNSAGLFHVTASSQFYYLLLLGIFVRIMVSSDLTESIELFSAVIAITLQNKVYDRKKVIMSIHRV